MTNSHPPTDGSANRGIAGPFTLPSLPIILVVAALGMSIDTWLAKAAFDLVIGENETISLLFALAVAVASGVSAGWTGIDIRRGARVAAWLHGGIWLALGVVLGAIRVNTGLLMGFDENDPRDLVVALIMFVVYVASGAAIIATSTHLWNPRMRVLRAARRAVRSLGRRLDRLEPTLARVRAALAGLERRRAGYRTEYQQACASLDALGAQLKHEARLRIAERLGDVRRTSVYRQPLWPDAEPTRPAE